MKHRLSAWLAVAARLPLAWYFLFFAGPLLLIATTSLLTRGTYGGLVWDLSLSSFGRVFDHLYLMIFLRSVVLATVTAVLCALIGFPIVWAATAAPPNKRSLLLFLLSLPFFTNLVIRIYALKLFTAHDGPLSYMLTVLNVTFDPFSLSQNLPLVIFGMVTTYLPFMILPLFTAFERFDDSLIDAAHDLGANHWQTACKVLIPVLKAPIISGFLMVFIPALGEFVIPDLLGGAKTMLIGNLITEQFLKARDWPFGAALTMILILIIGFSVIAARRGRNGEVTI
jgi:spermidine/putrescine transport system permease protein